MLSLEVRPNSILGGFQFQLSFFHPLGISSRDNFLWFLDYSGTWQGEKYKSLKTCNVDFSIHCYSMWIQLCGWDHSSVRIVVNNGLFAIIQITFDGKFAMLAWWSLLYFCLGSYKKCVLAGKLGEMFPLRSCRIVVADSRARCLHNATWNLNMITTFKGENRNA